MNPIEVQVKRSYYMRVIFIGLFSAGIGALIMYLEYRRWAKTFDGTGVTRQDGKQFHWTDLKEKRLIHMRSRYGKKGPLNHVELVFSDGKALVFYLMLENGPQIMTFLEKYSGEKQVEDTI